MEDYIVIVRTIPLFIKHKDISAENAVAHVRDMLNRGMLDDVLHNQGHTVNAYLRWNSEKNDAEVQTGI